MIGWLVWYSIFNQDLSSDQLRFHWRNAKLDPKHLPPPIRPRDAAARATAELELSWVDPETHRTYRTLARDVTDQPNEIERHIVLEIVDRHQRRLSHRAVAACHWTQSHPIAVTALDPAPWPEPLAQALRAVPDRFTWHRTHYTSAHLRSLILRTLKACDALAARQTGGVYFLPGDHETTCLGLRQFLDALPPSKFWMATLHDDASTQAMIAESLHHMVQIEGVRTVDKLRDALHRGEDLSPSELTRATAQFQRIRQLTARYAHLLQRSLDDTHDLIDVLQQQMRALLGADLDPDPVDPSPAFPQEVFNFG